LIGIVAIEILQYLPNHNIVAGIYLVGNESVPFFSVQVVAGHQNQYFYEINAGHQLGTRTRGSEFFK